MERTEVPSWAKSSMVPATPRQISFIETLLVERDFPQKDKDRLKLKLEAGDIGKTQASEAIEWLLKQPKLKSASRDSGPLYELPPGRYAIENNEGELRFYHLWEKKKDDGIIHRLYVLHGPDSSKLPMPAQQTIAKKILEAGPLDCAIRYGQEIGACSQCGRRLTNRISRFLGIGPVCGGRLHEDFADSVAYARQHIQEQGYDPDEEIPDAIA